MNDLLTRLFFKLVDVNNIAAGSPMSRSSKYPKMLDLHKADKEHQYKIRNFSAVVLLSILSILLVLIAFLDVQFILKNAGWFYLGTIVTFIAFIILSSLKQSRK